MVSASETGLARPARGRPRHLRHDAGSPLLEMITSNGMRAFGVITVLGLIGVAWAICFARAGHPVHLNDRNDEILAAAREVIAAMSPVPVKRMLLAESQPR